MIFTCFRALAIGAVLGGISTAEDKPQPYAKLGVLMEVSPEMGFLVPQVRKEVRLLNESLVAAGRDPVAYQEVEGFTIDKKGSLRTPARRNATYSLEALIKEDGVAGVLWITSLRGEETGFEMDELNRLFAKEATGPGGDEGGVSNPPQLLIHQIWQEQAQSAIRRIGSEDALDQILDEGLMREWVSVIKGSAGYLRRSWWMPDFETAAVFAFPSRVTHGVLLRKLDVRETAGQYHSTWTGRLRMRYGLEFSHPRETWALTVEGRRWCKETTIVPWLVSDVEPARWEKVYEQLTDRDTIDDDLAMIEADKLGVLFGFGYVKRDLSLAKTGGSRRENPRQRYTIELMRIGNEAKDHMEANRNRDDRVYDMNYLEVNDGKQTESVDEFYARRMAKMIREKNVDAIYFFTNGYTGSGYYGEFRVNEDLIEKAIREEGVRLYLRVPFEFGVVPMKLHRLAIASGGGVFFGKSGDPDFTMDHPEAEWPSDTEAKY